MVVTEERENGFHMSHVLLESAGVDENVIKRNHHKPTKMRILLDVVALCLQIRIQLTVLDLDVK